MMYGKEEDSESEGYDEFEAEAATALDPEADMEERVMALKNAIMLCMDHESGKDPGKDKGKTMDIALLLGKPKGR